MLGRLFSHLQNLNSIPARRFWAIVQALTSQFAIPITRILLSLTVVRWYSEVYWGTYVQYLLVVQLCATLINLGSRDFLLRNYSRSPDNIKNVLVASMLGRGGIAVVVVIIIGLLPWGALDRSILVFWLLAQLSWQFFEALNVYRRLFWQSAVIELLIVLLLIALFLTQPLTLTTFLWCMAVAELIKGLIYWLLNRHYISWKIVDSTQVVDFLKAAFPFLVLVLAGAGASRGELYLLALKMDAAALGKYQVLSSFVQSSHLLASAVLLPFIKNVYRLKAGVLFKIERNFLAFGLLLSPLLALMIYALLHYAYAFELCILIYCLTGTLIFLYFFQVIRIQMLFRQNQVQRVSLILIMMGAIKILGGWWLIPKLGISGALIAAVLAYIAGNVAFWQVRIKSLAQ
ncbi:MAG: hypothetical protein DHS20C18_15990 [Saprospiraceae bacterium]|nr:MAG: hypothetical protein DHS20C18_15990 [Saprospiraceae bacterium]